MRTREEWIRAARREGRKSEMQSRWPPEEEKRRERAEKVANAWGRGAALALDGEFPEDRATDVGRGWLWVLDHNPEAARRIAEREVLENMEIGRGAGGFRMYACIYDYDTVRDGPASTWVPEDFYPPSVRDAVDAAVWIAAHALEHAALRWQVRREIGRTDEELLLDFDREAHGGGSAPRYGSYHSTTNMGDGDSSGGYADRKRKSPIVRVEPYTWALTHVTERWPEYAGQGDGYSDAVWFNGTDLTPVRYEERQRRMVVLSGGDLVRCLRRVLEIEPPRAEEPGAAAYVEDDGQLALL